MEKGESHIRGIGKENANGTKILTFCIYQKKLIKGNGKKGKSHQRDWKGKGEKADGTKVLTFYIY